MVRTTRSGTTFIEALVSVMIIMTSILAMVGLWHFNYNLTQDHGSQNFALNLARRTLEEAKNVGYYGLPEGTLTRYTDANGNVQGATEVADSKFRLVISVVSTALSYDANGNVVGPAPTARRTLDIRVFDLEELQAGQPRLIAQTGTFFVRSGV